MSRVPTLERLIETDVDEKDQETVDALALVHVCDRSTPSGSRLTMPELA